MNKKETITENNCELFHFISVVQLQIFLIILPNIYHTLELFQSIQMTQETSLIIKKQKYKQKQEVNPSSKLLVS